MPGTEQGRRTYTDRCTPQDSEEHSRAIHRPEPMATIPADLPRFTSHLEHHLRRIGILIPRADAVLASSRP